MQSLESRVGWAGRASYRIPVYAQQAEKPVIRHHSALNFTDAAHGLLKIAYELAWHWLGDDYLHDDGTERLRRVILSDRPVARQVGL